MRRRITSTLLALVMVLALMPTAVLASPSRMVTFRYVEDHMQKTGDTSWQFPYSDSYFDESSYRYNNDLAKISLGLALSSTSSREATKAKNYSRENQNYLSFVKSCGFQHPESNEWMSKPPTTRSIGVNVAQKKIGKSCTLLAVGIRGDLYRSEWGGNLELGASGAHQNWDNASRQVLEFVRKYIADNNVHGSLKIWIAGYSRAAATANLTGSKLDDGWNLGKKVSLKPEDVYCYTFEAPMGAQKSQAADPRYNNIQNVLSENDIVTALPPKDWGFCRYGTDHLYPSRRINGADYTAYSDKEKAEVKQVPNQLFNIYWPDLYTPMGVNAPQSPKELYDRLGKALTTSFVTSRQDYVENVQDYLIDIFKAYYSQGDKDLSTSRALSNFGKKVQDNAGTLFQALINPQDNAVDVLMNYLVESFREENYIDYNYDQIKEMLQVLVPRLQRMAKAYPSETLTLLGNIINCLASHDIAPNIAWLEVLPDSYLGTHTAYSWN